CLAEPPAVVALGGGTVTDRATRRALLRGGVLITLQAAPEELARRVGSGEGRPLLAGDPVAALRRVLAERAPAYAECHGVVRTDREGALEEALRLVRERPVPVPLGERSYAVEIGVGVRRRLRARLAGASRAILVADSNTAPWRDALAEAGDVRVDLEEGEAHKDVAAVARIWDAALDASVDRRACVVAVGGGVVGDLAGFAAASLLRGVAFGQVPTSLLAMVDSSVGGKTGFNRAQGKNLVGAFHQPRFVLCDVETLSTLPAEERVAGLAEVLKAAWLDGEAAVAALERDAEALRAGDEAATIGAIRRSVALKARVVEADEREAGQRMVLNLGHTVGHGLEAAAGYGALRHGEAVGLGLVAAARVGVALGDLDAEQAGRLERLVGALGLPVDLDRRLDEAVWGFVGADKKRAGAQIRFVVPGPPGTTRIAPLSVEAIRAAVAV
ncbi:MAG TPA: 3-dehydroquinate synthase, partial [Polyangiaceae bacterium LLY-WYZ-15_(1-7)]|nr:3-dehydroquinate synthase [Polyangiaceae bacterium LLY-WYZ-15_(1-7)]